MHCTETCSNLRLISNCVFGACFIIILAELIQPGLVTNRSVWFRNITFIDSSDVVPVGDQEFNTSAEAAPQLILFWTDYFSQAVYTAESAVRRNAEEELSRCSVKNCVFTADRDLLLQSDAVLFHIRDIDGRPLPSVRDTNQYFIFYLLEAPPHTLIDLSRFEGFFNLTFTYRLDADLPAYDYHRQYAPTLWTKKRTGQEFQELWKGKTEFAAVFMSYCGGPSRRILYLKQLSQFMPLHVFGKCGGKQCDLKLANSTHCDGLVSKYKFYLAFENSICKDYMTEKVYRALNHGSIPVVYGGANYTAILPPHSFINVLDFPKPGTLARYLNYLAAQPLEYSKYFDWKFKPEYMTLNKRFQPESTSWCRLCKLLNRERRPRRMVQNLTRLWNDATDCARPVVERTQKNETARWLMNPVLNFTDSL